MRMLLFVVIACSTALAYSEQYRLKFSATVDVVEGGSVVGQKRLKAGTILQSAESVVVDGENKGVLGQIRKDRSMKAA